MLDFIARQYAKSQIQTGRVIETAKGCAICTPNMILKGRQQAYVDLKWMRDEFLVEQPKKAKAKAKAKK